jgi:hypothetical protein
VDGASRGRRYLRFIAAAALLVTVLLAIGFQPTRRLSGPEGVPAMLIGGGIGFVGAALAGIVIVSAGTKTPIASLRAMSYGMAVRLVTAVVLGAAAVWFGGPARTPLLLWLAISYVALLPLEVKLAVDSQN